MTPRQRAEQLARVQEVLHRNALHAYSEGVAAGRMKAAYDIRQAAVGRGLDQHRLMEECARIAERGTGVGEWERSSGG